MLIPLLKIMMSGINYTIVDGKNQKPGGSGRRR